MGVATASAAVRRVSFLSPGGLLALPVALAIASGVFALAFVIYVLWPRWPDAPIATDAPALPIVIGDVIFQLPPAAIRVKVQRRPGTQDRVDLAFLWPALTPGGVLEKSNAAATERIFVTIAAAPSALTPTERLRTIYPRYAEPTGTIGANGLLSVAFRNGTPYQGEDLLFDQSAPDHFLARCTRDKGPTPGTCLCERLLGRADITVRFPRDWLENWRTIAASIDQLIKQWQGANG